MLKISCWNFSFLFQIEFWSKDLKSNQMFQWLEEIVSPIPKLVCMNRSQGIVVKIWQKEFGANQNLSIFNRLILLMRQKCKHNYIKCAQIQTILVNMNWNPLFVEKLKYFIQIKLKVLMCSFHFHFSYWFCKIWSNNLLMLFQIWVKPSISFPILLKSFGKLI